jgi:hypothetical protein
MMPGRKLGDGRTDTDLYEEKTDGQEGEPEPRAIEEIETGEVPGFPDSELDFQDDYGTTDAMEAAQEDEVYFPPTDPVVRPARNNGGLEVLGGFAPTSDAEPIEEERHPLYIDLGDDEISSLVVRALAEDAATTDLTVDVETIEGVVYLRGAVPTLQDTDLAMEVAERVDGVLDVEDELEIAE